MNQRFKWLAPAAMTLLFATGVRAQETFRVGNQFAVLEDHSTSNLVVEGFDAAGDQNDGLVYNWSITTNVTTFSGAVNFITNVTPTLAGVQFVNSVGNYLASYYPIDQFDLNYTPYYPWDPKFSSLFLDYGAISMRGYVATNWGTYFAYTPQANWYGTNDTFVTSGRNLKGDDYRTTAHLTVLNVQDKPEVVGSTNIFILKCNADQGCNSTTGSVTIAAVDQDNAPVFPNELDKGLTYEFDQGSAQIIDPSDTNELGQIVRVGASDLGYATLSGSTVTFVVTNTTSTADVPQYVYVKVTDTLAWLQQLSGSPTNSEAWTTGAAGAANYEYNSEQSYWPLALGAQHFADDCKIVAIPVYYTAQKGAYFTDVSAKLAHGDFNASATDLTNNVAFVEFFEGEAATFSLTANDSNTNNIAGLPVSCYGVKKVIWTIEPWENSPFAVPFQTGVVQEVTSPIIETNGISSLSSSWSIDTSSETFTNGLNLFKIKVDAIDYCGQTKTFRWYVIVRPTLEYPLIDMADAQFPDRVLDLQNMNNNTWTAKIEELNGNDQFIDLWVTGGPDGAFDPEHPWNPGEGGLTATNNGDGTYTFFAYKTGCYTLHAYVRSAMDNGQVMSGHDIVDFCVLVPESQVINAVKTLVISGNDTNAFCYGKVDILPAEGNEDSIFTDANGLRGFLPSADVTYRAVASTTPEGAAYTFLHWGWDPSIEQNPTNSHAFAGGDLGTVVTNQESVLTINGLVAIFKKTSDIPAPVVNYIPTLFAVTNAYNNRLVGQPFVDSIKDDGIERDSVVVAQSECLSWLELRMADGSAVPEWLALNYQTIQNYTGHADPWGTLNHTVFANVTLTAAANHEPKVFAEYTLALFVVNTAGKEKQIGTFTLTEIPPPAAPAWLDPSTVTKTTTTTFNGWARDEDYNRYEGDRGSASMTVTLRPGKKDAVITGKFMLNSQSHTFKATGCYYAPEFPGDTTYAINAQYNWGTETRWMTLYVYGDEVWADAHQNDTDFELDLFRNTFTGATPVNGYYTLALPALDGEAGSGFLTLTVKDKGVITAAGRLGDGTTRSFSTTLLAVPQWFFDEEAQVRATTNSSYVAVLEALPASYKSTTGFYYERGRQGYFFGLVEFYQDPDQGKTVIRLYDSTEPIEWVNYKETATSNYGEGFQRAVGVAGGFYASTEIVQNYYKVGNLPQVAELAYTYKNGTLSETASAQATYWNPGGLTLAGFTAPKADSPKAISGGTWPASYDYTITGTDGVANDTGLKFSFTKATGLFRGTFNVYYDYVTAVNETTGAETVKHTSKKVTYQGVATPVREDLDDGYEGRGYFLMADKAAWFNYYSNKSTPYSFNWSYDFSLTK